MGGTLETAQALMQWESVLASLAELGVRSFGVIKGLLKDAGVDDDATLAVLWPKWDALLEDISRAAQPATVDDKNPTPPPLEPVPVGYQPPSSDV